MLLANRYVLENELEQVTTTNEHLRRLVAEADAMSGDRAVEKAKCKLVVIEMPWVGLSHDALIVPDSPQDDRSAVEDRGMR